MTEDYINNYLDEIQELLSRNYKDKICAFWHRRNKREYIGTGNFVKHNDKVFILSCNHVIENFYGNKESQIISYKNNKIYKNETSLKYYDKKNDIALIEIITSKKTLFNYYTIDDFSDFKYNDENLKECSFLIYGYPGQLVETNDDDTIESIINPRRNLKPFSFIAELSDKQNSDFLYLDYPKKTGNVDLSDGLEELPLAGGLSGSLITLLPNQKKDKNKIWQTKIVAIQFASDNRSYLECSKIKTVLDYFVKS